MLIWRGQKTRFECPPYPYTSCMSGGTVRDRNANVLCPYPCLSGFLGIMIYCLKWTIWSKVKTDVMAEWVLYAKSYRVPFYGREKGASLVPRLEGPALRAPLGGGLAACPCH